MEKEITLQDGRSIRPLKEEEKKSFEEEFQKLVTSHSVVLVPTLINQKTGITPGLEIYKVYEKSDTKTEESGTGSDGEPDESKS